VYKRQEQICDLQDHLKNSKRIAAILLDPFFFIQKSSNYSNRINTLRKQCSGSGIHFILDERKTAARIHLKGINFVFQFKADAVLIGGNYTNGIPFGAIASASSITGDSPLPGAYAPSSLAMRACLKITRKLIELNTCHHNEMIIKANRFAELVNQYFPKKRHKIKLENFGTVLWLRNTARMSLPGKLKEQGIQAPCVSTLYLTPYLDIKEFSDLAHRFALAINKPLRRKKKVKR
jgi:glutamate-1-semialdehyde aminotransferase